MSDTTFSESTIYSVPPTPSPSSRILLLGLIRHPLLRHELPAGAPLLRALRGPLRRRRAGDCGVRLIQALSRHLRAAQGSGGLTGGLGDQPPGRRHQEQELHWMLMDAMTWKVKETLSNPQIHTASIHFFYYLI